MKAVVQLVALQYFLPSRDDMYSRQSYETDSQRLTHYVGDLQESLVALPYSALVSRKTASSVGSNQPLQQSNDFDINGKQ